MAARRTARRPTQKARARRPLVRVTGTLALHQYVGEVLFRQDQATYLEGRGYGKLLARQVAETYQAAGFRVDGSSAHGYVVADRYGPVGRIDVVDVEGPFGHVSQ